MMKQLTALSIVLIAFAAAFPLIVRAQHIAHDITYVDRQFVKDAVAYNEAEIIAARAQSERGADPSVRAYAAQTLSFYLKANGHVEALAKQYNIQYVTYSSPMPEVRAVSAQQYMKQEAARHRHAVTLYEHQIKNGTNTPLKQYALETLPTIKSQLAMEQQYLASR